MDSARFVLLVDDVASVAPLLEELSDTVTELVNDESLQTAAITLSYQRPAVTGQLVGVELLLEGEASVVQQAREMVVDGLQTSGSVKHILGVSDSLVQAENAKLAARIYHLESRLREALSVLMLSACEDDYYSLLKTSQVQTNKDMPKADELFKGLENEFSYISFSDYRNVISRRMPSNVSDMLSLIQASTNYEELRSGLTPHMLSDPLAASFVASLSIVLDPIEKARNAVAHNRRLRPKTRADFERAAGQLEVSISDLFTEVEVPNTESGNASA